MFYEHLAFYSAFTLIVYLKGSNNESWRVEVEWNKLDYIS